jgi:thioredoxin-like negative regulator of GroEL
VIDRRPERDARSPIAGWAQAGHRAGLSASRLTTLLSLVLLLSIAAGTAAPVAVASPSAAAPPAAEGWLDDVAAARASAERAGKPILVDLWAAWCTWCKRLEQDVFSTPAFREFAQGFILLRVDTEDGGQGTRLMADFEVASLPTTLLLSHDLIKIGELQGYAPAEPYIQSLQLETAMYAALVRAYDDHRRDRAEGAGGGRAKATPSDGAETLQTLADELHARRDGARAAELYRELLERGDEDAEDGDEDAEDGDENAEENAWNRYYYADSLRLRHAYAEAREAVAAARAAAASIDNDELRERIDLLPYYLARDAGACTEARQAIDRFVAAHPDGVLLELAREEQRRLKSGEGCA